jgi:hypothetical protein
MHTDQAASADEQSICVTCGFCCDGTLFLHAHLNAGERGCLPRKIEENSISEEGKDFFRLPCHYFSDRCTIYDSKRADVCSSYRCQLLKDFEDDKIRLADALMIVQEAREIRAELFEKFKLITGNKDGIYFRQILRELGRIQERCPADDPLKMEYDILQVRCNIFEALLIKHIRSAGDFEKMKIDLARLV